MNRTVVKKLVLGSVIVVAAVGCSKRPLDKGLLYAARRGTIADVQSWLDTGADVNARSLGGFSGSTPLHEAAARGDVEMVSLLISAGADANAADDSGYTALFRAGTSETLEMLIHAGAELSATRNGQTALDWADENGFQWKSKILRKHAAETTAELR